MDENKEIKLDLAQTIRLSLLGQEADVRLFAARLVRKYRDIDSGFAGRLDDLLRAASSHEGRPLRRRSAQSSSTPNQVVPVDDESRLSLLKVYRDAPDFDAPFLSNTLKSELEQLIHERQQARKLISVGLEPSRSAIFTGQPGVGKTLTARWLAAKLGLPLYVLDLTAVMSSLLGKSGSNIRAAIDFAKSTPCILLLDEIDAIAKRRSDETDIGELKRLVTVILQEVDEWPSAGLLLAATNHPELIDPALWRRFDLVIEFKLPSIVNIREALDRFLGADFPKFSQWVDILPYVFKGKSFSDIEREIHRFRRSLALGGATSTDLIEGYIKSQCPILDKKDKIELATLLSDYTKLSQHTISDLTTISRDTIRKYKKVNKLKRRRAK